MDLDLEKIDEQLQMSRKMFPSWFVFNLLKMNGILLILLTNTNNN